MDKKKPSNEILDQNIQNYKEFRFGTQFQTSTGIIEPQLKNYKIICLYYAASWCPPCQSFTPLLIEFYNNCKEKGDQLDQMEVILIPLDKDEQEYKRFFGVMPWLSIPFNDKKRIQESLNIGKISVNKIPQLFVLKHTGEIITTNGKNQIMENPDNAFKLWIEKINE